MLMNLRQIRAFLLVAQHKSFTRASDKLGVTQAAVSQMIREFEGSVGMPVFARSTRSIHLTPVGESLHVELERIVDDLDNVFSTVSAAISVRQGNVKVACLSSIAVKLLPKAIAHCRKMHPAISITIQDDVGAKVIDRVKSGAVDFGIGTNELRSTEIDFKPLFRERFSVVCNKRHPFAKLRSVTWGRLCETQFVGMTDETGLGRLINRIDEEQTQHLNVVIRVSQLSTILGQLEENLGVSLLPEIAKPSPRHHALTTIPLSGIEISRSIGVIRRPDRPLSPAASAVLDTFAIVTAGAFKSPNVVVVA